MISVRENCERAKASVRYLSSLTTEAKNDMLRIAAEALVSSTNEILAANARDIAANSGMQQFLLDRLTLNEARVKSMSDGLMKLIELADPVGEVTDEWYNHAGLLLKKVRVPFGVVGIIYEARPNVTADAIGLCIKTSNAIVLRGSKSSYASNRAIVDAITKALSSHGYESDFIQLVEDLSHESSHELMTARGLVDVLIPRGSAKLIQTVVTQSTVPVIETGAGNCHAYIHKSADPEIAKKIILNGKLRRPSVCNALESIVVDEAAVNTVLPVVIDALRERGVVIRGCKKTVKAFPDVEKATEDDFYAEYLDAIISCKVVKNYSEAIDHINKYGTHHSDVIISDDVEAENAFMKLIDSAAVYHNASTAFTDGFEYGFGAEMGISTQKLHARGPMGLKELTSYKYCIFGNGQTRN